MKKTILSSIFMLFTIIIHAQIAGIEAGLPHIHETVIKSQLDFLASDWLEGRETGERGADMAADYIQCMYRYMGLRTIPSKENESKAFFPLTETSDGYFQDFPLLKKTNFKTTEFIIKQSSRSYAYSEKVDFSSAYHQNTKIRGNFDLVFAGYGLVKTELAYDDYANLDVKNKAVIIIDGFPGHRDTASTDCKAFAPNSTNKYAQYKLMREKINWAKEKGAAAILIYDRNNDGILSHASNIFRYNLSDYEGDTPPNRAFTNPLRLYTPDAENEIAAYFISKALAQKILSNVDINAFENEKAKSKKKFTGTIDHSSISLKASADEEIIRARNVIGIIPGKNTSEAVIIGAHYDHVGKYDGFIYNGADDNASGTAGMMTVARACLATGVQPKRTIIFAAWSAEEKGLWGSNYFVNHNFCDSVVAYINYDMIGRNSDTDDQGIECGLTYTKNYTCLQTWTQEFIDEYQLDLTMLYKAAEVPRGGSDYASFSKAGYPVMAFMTAMHDDYHRPSDEADKINYKKLTNISRLGYLLVWKMANMENWEIKNTTNLNPKNN